MKTGDPRFRNLTNYTLLWLHLRKLSRRTNLTHRRTFIDLDTSTLFVPCPGSPIPASARVRSRALTRTLRMLPLPHIVPASRRPIHTPRYRISSTAASAATPPPCHRPYRPCPPSPSTVRAAVWHLLVKQQLEQTTEDLRRPSPATTRTKLERKGLAMEP